MKEPASQQPNASSAHESESPAAARSRKVPVRTPSTTARAGAALKAQLDSVRYPAGRRDQRRRVVTTHVVGTPRSMTARRNESTPLRPSSTSTRDQKARSPSSKESTPVVKDKRPSSALASTLRRNEAATDVKASPSPLRQAQSALGFAESSDAEADKARCSPERTPVKLKLRKSIGSVTKTPANSPSNST